RHSRRRAARSRRCGVGHGRYRWGDHRGCGLRIPAGAQERQPLCRDYGAVMPTLNQNVLINGKVIPKGKSISAANAKKLELGDHLFDAEVKAPAKADESSKDDSKSRQGDDESASDQQ